MFLRLKQSVSPHETECFGYLNIVKLDYYDVTFCNVI